MEDPTSQIPRSLQRVWRMLGTSDGCAASSLAPPRGWRLERRREFIAALGTAAAWPLVACAQPRDDCAVIDRGHVMAGSERNDPVELAVEERVARDNERANVLNDDGRECIFEIAFAAGVENVDWLANSTSRDLHIAQQQLGFRTVGVDKHADE